MNRYRITEEGRKWVEVIAEDIYDAGAQYITLTGAVTISHRPHAAESEHLIYRGKGKVSSAQVMAL